VDAKPILVQVARALREQGLDAVLIGNAAAALQGAPVTTLDIDFFMRKTPANITKLKHLAQSLGAIVCNPFYPVSGLYRLSRDHDVLQLRCMTRVDGIASLNGIRSRATVVELGGDKLWVAPRVWPYDMTSKPRSRKRKPTREEIHQALLKESERNLRRAHSLLAAQNWLNRLLPLVSWRRPSGCRNRRSRTSLLT
jgi:hypothetical protein